MWGSSSEAPHKTTEDPRICEALHFEALQRSNWGSSNAHGHTREPLRKNRWDLIIVRPYHDKIFPWKVLSCVVIEMFVRHGIWHCYFRRGKFKRKPRARERRSTTEVINIVHHTMSSVGGYFKNEVFFVIRKKVRQRRIRRLKCAIVISLRRRWSPCPTFPKVG